MYGKIFASMYDGTLRTKWQALVTFQQMIVLCDEDGVIDMTAESISARTGIPLGVITEGVEFLEQPDKFSRTPDAEGRRIERLNEHRPWGWRIVNYAKYRSIRSVEERREYHRQYWHKRKLNGAQPDSTITQPVSTATQQTQPIAEAEVEAKRERRAQKRSARVPEDFVPDLPLARSILADVDAEREAQKFRDWEFKTPRSDWAAAWRNWLQRCKERGEYARLPKASAMVVNGKPVEWQ